MVASENDDLCPTPRGMAEGREDAGMEGVCGMDGAGRAGMDGDDGGAGMAGPPPARLPAVPNGTPQLAQRVAPG